MLVHVLAALRHSSILHPAPVASIKMFEFVLGWFDRVVIKCVAVLAYDAPNVIVLSNMTRKAIESVFSWRVIELVCRSLSFPCVDIVVSFVDRLT